MTPNPILDKIKKLLAVANDKGATEDEAATAMRLASGMMAKHGIRHEDIPATGETPKATRRRSMQQLRPYEVDAYQAAGVLYGCDLVMYDRGKAGIEFIGRPMNIEAAEMTAQWLMQQIERFYKEALPRGLSVAARAEFRRTFKQACASRIVTRAFKIMADVKRDDKTAMEFSGSTALVVVNHFALLHQENRSVMNEMALRVSRSRPKKLGSGTIAGWAAGDRVKLRQEIKQ